jgi:hypothetical protein
MKLFANFIVWALGTDRQDAARYRWLKKQIRFDLGSYDGPDCLPNANRSYWHMLTAAIFEGTNIAPENIDAVVDTAMAGSNCPICGRCFIPFDACCTCGHKAPEKPK